MIPGKPGPAPRAAHSRSGFSRSSAWTSVPAAVTTSRPATLWQAQPQGPAVPALAALQQEAAQADRRAVTAGKGPAPFGQKRRQLPPALHGRAGRDHPGGRVVPDVPQLSQVDQQGVVAQAPRRPRVPAGAHRDRPAALARQPHALDHVVVAPGLEHGRREPVRAPRVEDAASASLLVARLAPQDQPPREPSATSTAPPSGTAWSSRPASSPTPAWPASPSAAASDA